MKKKIPTYPEISEELESTNSESQILNSPISTNLENSEPELKYSINDLIGVWIRGCTNGATLWVYCQEHEKTLPSSFEFGLQLLNEELLKVEDKHIGLHELTSNNLLLVGLFQELINRK